jgi:muramoyltetrapeptide carboxypeptidase
MNASSILFPPRFAPGDLIGLTTPASPPDKPELIDETIARLTAFGFRIKPGKNVRKRDSYLAGSDEERAEDINAMFADPEVKAIYALRGGYGSCRILPLLDYEAMRANPKPFVGYSDVTAMHNAILVKAGLVTYHGSNASSAFQSGNEAACRRVLLKPADPTAVTLFSKQGEEGKKLKTVVPGRVIGRLIGGNMTCLLRLLATPYAPDFRGAILFLEDTGEKAYRVDGNFCHLRLAGVLDQIAGLIIGQFDHIDPTEETRIATCLQREAERIGVPSVAGAPIGHFVEQITVPHGAQVDFDAEVGRLSLARSEP